MSPQELRAFCLSFNAAVEDFPFTPETSVFKVLGKIVRPLSAGRAARSRSTSSATPRTRSGCAPTTPD